MNIGVLLKKIRKEKSLTLRDVAQNTTLTASLISQIETGKTSPSLNSLSALLKYYKTSASDFFKQVEQKDYIYVSSTELETIKNKSSGIGLSLLASKLKNNVTESYIAELPPNAKIDVISTEPETKGERLIYILSGNLEASLNGKAISMSAGDSLIFESYLKCSISNKSSVEKSKLLITGEPNIF